MKSFTLNQVTLVIKTFSQGNLNITKNKKEAHLILAMSLLDYVLVQLLLLLLASPY